MPCRDSNASDRGAVFLSVLGCVLFATLAASMIFGLGTRAAARARVDAAAELVALAAAQEPGSIAADVAAANKVRIEATSRAGQSTVVDVVSGTMRGRASAHLAMSAVECSPGLLHCRGGTRR